MVRDLEVRHCRVLVAVHESGGVGAAARAMGVAQSTVSETLLSLERLLCAPVTLRRAGRETALTAAAEALLPHARSLISISEAALAASLGAIKIRLGTVESISSFLLPQPLAAFRQSWPQADVQITIGLCEDLRKRVARSELDMALTIEGSRRDRGDSGGFWPARLRLVVSPGHPLTRVAVRPQDLEGRRCLVTDSDGAFNELIRSWAGSAARPLRLESAGSVDGVKRGVLSSDAIGLLPDYAVGGEMLVALETQAPLPAISLRVTTGEAMKGVAPLESLIDEIHQALRGRSGPS